ncbi:conserved hypothetical protein [Chloroherpeton thalassium ATCC 35110]|uniref:Uncharacterized protein n=1 Tax=Chloroherpeton thalassium (strain ATCC 35110 / GB-78) TaxID=517418 RepID=B3QT47_CHLT3|nr:hypothetical protein [Chloroherpeton thalassium]ACF14146.1 conserved hypothetical protein [Chloroherpeton thalassium ATCC 35110]
MDKVKKLDLWPENLNITDAVTPVTILKEQANLLGEKTQNVVTAEISTATLPVGYLDERGFFFDEQSQKNLLLTDFYLSAPILKYRYKLLQVIHPLSHYPVIIKFDEEKIPGRNENEFIESLKKIFSSKKTIRIIQSLIASSQ